VRLIECTPLGDYYTLDSDATDSDFSGVQFSSAVADIRCANRPNSRKDKYWTTLCESQTGSVEHIPGSSQSAVVISNCSHNSTKVPHRLSVHLSQDCCCQESLNPLTSLLFSNLSHQWLSICHFHCSITHLLLHHLVILICNWCHELDKPAIHQI